MSTDARLRWRCRRGIHELDALLEPFVARDLAQLDGADKARLEALLELPDPVLHAYLMGHEEPDSPDTARIVARIRASLVPIS